MTHLTVITRVETERTTFVLGRNCRTKCRVVCRMKKINPTLTIFGAIFATILIACGGTGSATPGPLPSSVPSASPSQSPSPSSTPAPTPSPTGRTLVVTSPAQAAALVFASDARWTAMMPLRPDLIGASMWYEASEDGDGFAVKITAGSGDCQAGCMNKHNWNYTVDRDGTVTLASEDGDPVVVNPVGGLDGPARVTIQLTAGPVCPVEQNPPDPNCAGRAVANAEVVIYDANGVEIDRAMSDQDGMVTIEVPGGSYYVVPQPVEGLMGTPEAAAFSVPGSGSADLVFSYDTGIR
jgi:hypothetical protein